MEQIRARLDQMVVSEEARETYREFPPFADVKQRYVDLLQIQKDAIRMPKVTRAEHRQFNHRMVEVAGGFRDTLADPEQGCTARLVATGQPCGAALTEDVHHNTFKCAQHLARSSWMRTGAHFNSASLTFQGSTPPGGDCVWCGCRLEREPFTQCAVCERGVHLQCLAEALDPTACRDRDPHIFCARCVTETYDEFCAFRALDPEREVVVLDRPCVWDEESNVDVYHDHCHPSLVAQPGVTVLWTEYVPPSPAGATPLSAARERVTRAEPATPVPPRRSERVHQHLAAQPAPAGDGRVVLTTGAGMADAPGLRDTQQQEQIEQALPRLGMPAEGDALRTQLAATQGALRGGTGPVHPAPSTTFHLPKPHPEGQEYGYKAGEIGSPSSQGIAGEVLYLGVGAASKPQRREVSQLTNGAESLTEKQEDSAYWPGAAGSKTEVRVDNKTILVNQCTNRVPTPLALVQYLAQLGQRWLSLLHCGSGVYSPGHPDYLYYKATALLILARIEYIKETQHYLDASGYTWPAAWRYLLLLWERRMKGYGVRHSLPFDRLLVDAYICEVRQIAMQQYASSTIMLPELLRSEAAAAAAAEIASLPAPLAYQPPRAPHAATPQDTCALCSATDHIYRAPHYGCTQVIRNPCPLALTDGKVCGLKHAHSGPRRTPCRGGLEPTARGQRRAGSKGKE